MGLDKRIFEAFTTCLVLLVIFIIHANAINEHKAEHEHHFDYGKGKKGPANWGELHPYWQTCKTGKIQSPIDLRDSNPAVESDLGTIKRHYKEAPAVLRNRGHDIVVLWTGDVGGMIINGTEYKLLQCHWHIPSEHTIEGERMNMELHVVHNSTQGQLAVVSVLYKLGHSDTFLGKFLDAVKKASNRVGKEDIDLGLVNPWTLKLGSTQYYRYIGSLTVPPCTEGVIWTVLKKVRTVSEEQIRILRNAVEDDFENNARPIQDDWDGRSGQFLDQKSIATFVPQCV